MPGAFVSREMFSSRMLPPLKRFSVSPVARFLNVPSEGPPVPAAWLFGSLAYGLSRANYMHSDAASQGGNWWQGCDSGLTAGMPAAS